LTAKKRVKKEREVAWGKQPLASLEGERGKQREKGERKEKSKYPLFYWGPREKK